MWIQILANCRQDNMLVNQEIAIPSSTDLTFLFLNQGFCIEQSQGEHRRHRWPERLIWRPAVSRSCAALEQGSFLRRQAALWSPSLPASCTSLSAHTYLGKYTTFTHWELQSAGGLGADRPSSSRSNGFTYQKSILLFGRVHESFYLT